MKHETRQLAQHAKNAEPAGCGHFWLGGVCLHCGKVKRKRKPKWNLRLWRLFKLNPIVPRQAKMEPSETMFTPLTNLIAAATELIASIKSRPANIPESERAFVITQLRQLGRCAYQLAQEFDDEIQKRGKK